MRTCEISPSHIPILQKWAKSSGYPYIDPKDALVVTDDEGNPIMAAAPHIIVEMYLWADPSHPPTVKLHALRMLHDALIPEMKRRGFTEVNAFLPPEIERSFGRRLMRSFGWCKNWGSYFRIL